MTPGDFLLMFETTLQHRRVPFSRAVAIAFVESCWPLIDDEPDVDEWADRFTEAAAEGARTNKNEATLQLVRELWEQSSPERRCPHVSYDGQRCRCGAVDEQSAELVCDTASLQLWCLDGARYPSCLFFPK